MGRARAHAGILKIYQNQSLFEKEKTKKENSFTTMTQVQFDFQNKINALEGLNTELYAENETLKQKIADLGFEVALLKDVCNLDESEETDALIEDLRQNIRDKNVELCALQLSIADKESEIEALKATLVEKEATITEKDTEITNLRFTFNAATTHLNADDLLEIFNQAESNVTLNDENPNEKIGEDFGEDSIAGRAKRRRSNNAEMNLFSYAEVDDVEELQE